MKITTCRSCGAKIVWIKTKNGRTMPCDAEAVEYQNNRYGKDLVVTSGGDTVRCDVIKQTANSPLDRVVDGTGYISHFATCPYANSYRVNKK